MNRTAYVICWFKVVGDVPTFKGAGIYSENAQSITVEGDIIPMDVVSATGSDFEDAIKSVKWMVEHYHRLQWLSPHLERQHG